MDATHLAIPNLIVPVGLNLRNGVMAAIGPATRAAAVRPEYYWHYIDILRGEHAAELVMAAIAESFGRIASVVVTRPSQAAGYVAAGGTRGFAATPAGAQHATGDTTDWAPTVAAANANNELRFRAICLGAARTGLATAWRLTGQDIRTNEIARSEVIQVLRGAAVPPATVGPVTGYALPATQTNAASSITMPSACAIGMHALSEDEIDLAHMVFLMAMAAVPLCGCELLETGHHYLSSNLAPTMAVERQVFANARRPVENLWKAYIDVGRDMVWHKAAHAIESNLMTTAATSRDVKERLMRAGLGSAAVRLPYVESAMRGARAMAAVYNAVSSTLAEAGYVVAIPLLLNAITYMDNFNHVNIAETETGYTPTSRFDAIENYLRVVMERAASYVSWCAGVYKGICEDAGVSLTTNTLLRSRAVSRAVMDYVGSAASGRAAYDNYRKFVREQLKEGNLPAIRMVLEHVTPVTAAAPATATTAGIAAATAVP